MCRVYKLSQFVLVSLTHLAGTMHNIRKLTWQRQCIIYATCEIQTPAAKKKLKSILYAYEPVFPCLKR